MNKQLFIEANRLKDEAYSSDSRHCFSVDHECNYLEVTRDQYATGDSPDAYDCTCNDATDCPAVQAVYAEMENLKEDIDVTYLALEKVASDIAMFSDGNNGLALSILIAKALRVERLQTAKERELI